MRKRTYIAANLMLCFLLSDVVVFICHKRNPYLRFLSSPASYVLFALSALSVVYWLLCRLRRQKRGTRKRQ